MRLLTIQQKLENKVAAIIARKGPHPLFSPAHGLWVVSRLYGAAMRLRRTFYNQGVFTSHRLPCFVISVGNLCIGGTGKTPMTVHLAELLGVMGYKRVVLSRGYKGLCERKGTVVSDGRTILCDARHAGDEPFLMANLLHSVPVVVGQDRVAAAHLAVKRFQPDVLVLDDGFQHQRLKRDLNLLLLDAREPFGNSFVLPRGALREPISALSNADAVIMTRCDSSASPNAVDLANRVSPRPVFCASHRSVLRGILPAGQRPRAGLLARSNASMPHQLRGRRVFSFSGLAHNDIFWDSLRKLGAQLDGTLGFRDHHPYDAANARYIARAAQAAGSDCLVTTDKDYVRLPQTARFTLDLLVMGIAIDFKDEDEPWRRFITDRLGQRL